MLFTYVLSVLFWASQSKMAVRILEWNQQRAPEVMEGLEYLTNEERLSELELLNLGKRRHGGACVDIWWKGGKKMQPGSSR